MTDLLLNEQFDLTIDGGDLVAGEATQQHQELLLLLDAGELRQYPTRGVGLRNYLLEDAGVGAINSAVKREFEQDGMQVSRIQNLPDGRLKIQATYG